MKIIIEVPDHDFNWEAATIWPLALARMYVWVNALPPCSWKPLIGAYLTASPMCNGQASRRMHRIISSMRFRIWRLIWGCAERTCGSSRQSRTPKNRLI